MEFGIYLDLRKTDDDLSWPRHYRQALELCEWADEMGAASAWLSEHHGFADGYLPQPMTFAAAVAVRTTTMRIGTAVLLAGLRHPAHVAEEAAVVDILSDGRLDLGLGGGYRVPEFELFGADPRRPLEGLFAAYDEIVAMLGGSRITPGPVQAPLPVWLGCNGPVGARRAGRIGGRLLSVRRRLHADYRAGLIEGRHDPAAALMSGPVNVFLCEDPERDRAVVERAYGYIWDTYAAASVEGTGAPAPPPADLAAAVSKGLAGGQRGLLVTTPADAARQLAAYFAGVPVQTLFSWAMLPGVPEVLSRRHVELWTTVLPRLVDRELSVAAG